MPNEVQQWLASKLFADVDPLESSEAIVLLRQINMRLAAIERAICDRGMQVFTNPSTGE